MNYIGRIDREWTSKKEGDVHPLQRLTNFTQILTNGDRVADEGIIQICHETARRAGHDRFSIGSDFDGTMFQEDIGVTAFIDKVRNPEFWKLDTVIFEQNLVSDDLRKGYESLLSDEYNISTQPKYFDGIEITNIRQLASWVQINLIPEIIRLHKEIREEVLLRGFDSQRERINEFISLLIFLDNITMELESFFSSLLNGRIIPRTRLFAGMTEKAIKQTVVKLYGIPQNSPDATFTVNFDNPTLNGAEGVEIKSKTEEISSRATKVTDIKRLFRKVIFLDVGILNIITTNLPVVARTALETAQSPYFKMTQEQLVNLSEREVNPKHFVYGTDLVVSNGILLPELEEKAILRQQKIQRFDRISKTSLGLIACGDTGNDSGMMVRALRNGGFAIIVSKDPNKSAERFGKTFRDAGIGKEHYHRVLHTMAV